ncbi:MAG: orotidine-5'-phosphate decarboxylase, partial [Pseudomonadales bacterium]|nr:orotidine-5'-phosphate decarboxylase [Pseudomonadales bacterium]
KAARAELDALESPPLLIAVTVLTSASKKELEDMNVFNTVEQQVCTLAAMAKKCGLDGVVCSAREVAVLREKLGTDFVLVTPGIRPAKSDNNDQKRVVTPEEAIGMGSDFLVIGRPVTQSADPVKSLLTINESISYIPDSTK